MRYNRNARGLMPNAKKTAKARRTNMIAIHTIKVLTLTDGSDDTQQKRRYLQVENPIEGFEGKEIFQRQSAYNFVHMLAKDEAAMAQLKARIADGDEKPIVFDLVDSKNTATTRVHELNIDKNSTLFAGADWSGIIADYHGEAWIIFCTNGYR